ncbi:MAG: serine hydrolase, partial [bacterium]|nr:serine hydrolase [bacterium]
MYREASKTAPPLKNATLQDLIRSYEARYRFSISFITSLISDRQGVFSWQSDIRRPAASLIKLFVLGALAEEIASGNYDARKKITVHTFVGGSGLLKYVGASITLTLEELAHFMLAYSDNSATNRLIELLTLDRVNEFINKIGARNTMMIVPMMPTKTHGLKDYNYTTADDILLFYKGLNNGFPKSIHLGCAPLCRKFFVANHPSFLNTMTFFVSAIQM